MISRRGFVSGSLACFAARAAGAAARVDLSPSLATIIEQRGLPGLIAAAIEGDSVVAAGVAGRRRIDRPEPIAIDDLFHIGSNTKSMTATLCAMLVEEGRLAWNSTIGEVFGDVKSMRPQWHDVTLEQLLVNRGGMPATLDADGLWRRLRAHKGTPTQARRTLLEGVVSAEPAAEPGSKFIYSNAGFAVAGHMAETVMGRPWEDLLHKRLFEPLGMRSTGFGAPGTSDAITQPRGHTEKGKPVEPGPSADNPPAIGPAGTVHCSIPDYAKYLSMHIAGARGQGRLLKPESFARMHAPAAGEKYAMGWVVEQRPWGRGKVLVHAGSNTMWYLIAWVAPNVNFAFVAGSNQGGEAANKACDEAVLAAIRRTVGGV